MQLASLADMGISLPRENKLPSVCCLSSMYVYLLFYSSVGRIVGVSELCSYVSFYSLYVWPVGSRTQAMLCVN